MYPPPSDGSFEKAKCIRVFFGQCVVVDDKLFDITIDNETIAAKCVEKTGTLKMETPIYFALLTSAGRLYNIGAATSLPLPEGKYTVLGWHGGPSDAGPAPGSVRTGEDGKLITFEIKPGQETKLALPLQTRLE